MNSIKSSAWQLFVSYIEFKVLAERDQERPRLTLYQTIDLLLYLSSVAHDDLLARS